MNFGDVLGTRDASDGAAKSQRSASGGRRWENDLTCLVSSVDGWTPAATPATFDRLGGIDGGFRSRSFRSAATLAAACEVATPQLLGDVTPLAKRFEFRETHMGTEFKLVVYTNGEKQGQTRLPGRLRSGRPARPGPQRLQARQRADATLRAAPAARPCRRQRRPLLGPLTAQREIAERTGGAFDPTVKPVVKLWRRARRQQEMPDPDRLAEALRAGRLPSSSRSTHGSRPSSSPKPGMQLDLGGHRQGARGRRRPGDPARARDHIGAGGRRRGHRRRRSASRAHPAGASGSPRSTIPTAPPERFLSLIPCGGLDFRRLRPVCRRSTVFAIRTSSTRGPGSASSSGPASRSSPPKARWPTAWRRPSTSSGPSGA